MAQAFFAHIVCHKIAYAFLYFHIYPSEWAVAVSVEWRDNVLTQHFSVMWEHCLQEEEYGPDGGLILRPGEACRRLPHPVRWPACPQCCQLAFTIPYRNTSIDFLQIQYHTCLTFFMHKIEVCIMIDWFNSTPTFEAPFWKIDNLDWWETYRR